MERGGNWHRPSGKRHSLTDHHHALLAWPNDESANKVLTQASPTAPSPIHYRTSMMFVLPDVDGTEDISSAFFAGTTHPQVSIISIIIIRIILDVSLRGQTRKKE
ncbi:hypothetical protein H072_2185 [Dactylellina haptotyla CBS 200.50]|uniref:Uncharacterized protein n=1 Tax=Dactylellina haptotyla (strain CBS 200.50) TaxID=1284197 RepID=S8BWN3_DACHA|nr:hypothetical protein H072_2185 [Dactylellina haptotyla CBS 200.50]